MPMFLVARSVLVRSTKCNQMHVVSRSVSCFCSVCSVCSVCCPTGCRYLLQGWWISTCHAAWRLWQQIMTYLRLIMVDQYIADYCCNMVIWCNLCQIYVRFMSDLCQICVYLSIWNVLERCTMHSIWWQSAESIQKNADPLMQNLERMRDGFRGRLHASYTTGGSLCEGWRVSKTAIHKCCQVQHIAVHIICYSQVTSEDTETDLKWNDNWPGTGDEFACKPRGNGSDSAGQVLVA